MSIFEEYGVFKYPAGTHQIWIADSNNIREIYSDQDFIVTFLTK